MRQIKGHIWFGRLKVVFAREAAYFGYINFALMLSTFYVVHGYVYAPAWMFGVGAVAGIIIIGMFDYFIVLPSEQAFINEQAVKHQNPMYDKIIKIEEDMQNSKEAQ
jgi:hypothetical protein